jgi:hypothetical protein
MESQFLPLTPSQLVLCTRRVPGVGSPLRLFRLQNDETAAKQTFNELFAPDFLMARMLRCYRLLSSGRFLGPANIMVRYK